MRGFVEDWFLEAPRFKKIKNPLSKFKSFSKLRPKIIEFIKEIK
jgi:hypothetical protein